MEKLLLSLNIPYPATLRDTQHCVKAYSQGCGISDYHQQIYQRDRQDWDLLLRWLDAQESSQSWLDEKVDQNPVHSLSNAS